MGTCVNAKDGQLLNLQLLFLLVPFWFRHTVGLEEPGGAGIPIPIKVVFRIAVALVVETILLACRAMCEGYVIVCDVVEEVDLFFLQH